MRETMVVVTLAVALAGCGQPTREELIENQQAKHEYCEDMLQDIKDNEERPLIRATLQENYNRECLGQTYPAGVQ